MNPIGPVQPVLNRHQAGDAVLLQGGKPVGGTNDACEDACGPGCDGVEDMIFEKMPTAGVPVGPGVKERDFSYVGHGHGCYRKLEDFGFVGNGQGSYVREEITTYQGC